MPAIIAAIGAVLIQLLRIWMVSIIGRVLLTMGVGLFAYEYGVPALLDFVADKFHALPAFPRQLAGALGLDVFSTMILSAYAVKITSRVFFGRAVSE